MHPRAIPFSSLKPKKGIRNKHSQKLAQAPSLQRSNFQVHLQLCTHGQGHGHGHAQAHPCFDSVTHRSPERGIYTSMSCHGPSPILVTAPTRKHCCGRDQFQNPTASCKEPNFVKQVEIIIADPPSRFTHGTFPCVVILTKKEKEKTKFGITLSALPCSCFTAKTNHPFIHVVYLISWILQRESKTSTLRSPSSDVGFQNNNKFSNWTGFFPPRFVDSSCLAGIIATTL